MIILYNIHMQVAKSWAAYCVCTCVCVCVRACVRACVCACVRVCVITCCFTQYLHAAHPYTILTCLQYLHARGGWSHYYMSGAAPIMQYMAASNLNSLSQQIIIYIRAKLYVVLTSLGMCVRNNVTNLLCLHAIFTHHMTHDTQYFTWHDTQYLHAAYMCTCVCTCAVLPGRG